MNNWFPLGSRSPTGNLETSPCQSAFNWACRVQSVFQWYDYLAMIFVPSLETEYVITHIEPSTKFTQQALNGSNQVISLLN